MDIFDMAERASRNLSICSEELLSPLGDVAHKELRRYNELLETNEVPREIEKILFGKDVLNILLFTLDLHNSIVINQEPWLDDPCDDYYFELRDIQYRISTKTEKLKNLEDFIKFCKFKKCQTKKVESYNDLLQCLSIFEMGEIP